MLLNALVLDLSVQAEARSEFCRICDSSLNSSLARKKEISSHPLFIKMPSPKTLKPGINKLPSSNASNLHNRHVQLTVLGKAGLVISPEPSLSQISKSGFRSPFKSKSVIHPSSPTVYWASLS